MHLSNGRFSHRIAPVAHVGFQVADPVNSSVDMHKSLRNIDRGLKGLLILPPYSEFKSFRNRRVYASPQTRQQRLRRAVLSADLSAILVVNLSEVIPLFPPGITVHVVAALLPIAGLIMCHKLNSAYPFGTLPSV